jgi:hypothetical protein
MSIVDLSVNLKSKTKRKFSLITSGASSDCQDNANTTSSSSSSSSSNSNGSSSSSNGSSSSSESRSDVISTVAIVKNLTDTGCAWSSAFQPSEKQSSQRR